MTSHVTLVDRLYGTGDLDALFGRNPSTPAPWPSASRQRGQPAFDRDAVAGLLRSPPNLATVDPRGLRANQPWVLREHVAYYLSGRWERTGRTAADRLVELNRFPVVVTGRRGEPVIVSGHHRAAAALLEGRALTIRIAGPPIAITPTLWFDPASPSEVSDVSESIAVGRTAIIGTVAKAESVLRRLGLDDEEVRHGLSHVAAPSS